ncbi:MAG TPA: glycosyltransferase [Candidatus Acidoferrales bacterium]|nr:glycosyltransferase [Candidatus Acidoferrales bacterium]
MKIGVVSPLPPHELADHLDATSRTRLPAIRGVPAPQVTALVRGVPVIGGCDSGAVPWTLEEGWSGYLCDVRDECALGKTIIEVLEQPDRNRDLVKRAWGSAQRRFNQDQAVNANEEILRQLLTAGSRTPK